MPELEWHEAARADLLAIIDYISDHNPDAAQQLKDDIGRPASSYWPTSLCAGIGLDRGEFPFGELSTVSRPRKHDVSRQVDAGFLPQPRRRWHEQRMALDFTPLANAVARLAEGLARYRADESDSQIRDGLIQRFEFTYDLSHKLLRRALEAGSANPEEVDRMSFPTLIRTAAEQGLVGSDWAQWRTWREMRNITSHTYDEAKALTVAAAIPDFLAEAQDLLRRLTATNAA